VRRGDPVAEVLRLATSIGAQRIVAAGDVTAYGQRREARLREASYSHRLEFGEWLLGGNVPNNYGNWQWVAGTGTDTKPHRRFSPERQARRFDPDGAYVRRFVDELS
jgi:deoxyribodipyrimidine photolyase